MAFSGCIASQNDTGKNNGTPNESDNQGKRTRNYPDSGVWPGHRVDSANTGHHPNEKGPEQGVEKKWLSKEGGKIHGVYDDRIYFDISSEIYSIEKSGKNISKISEVEMNQPEITIDDDTLYAGGPTPQSSSQAKVVALNKQDGSERWRFMPKNETDFDGEFSIKTPIEATEDRVIFGAEVSENYDTKTGFIYAVDKDTGDKIWEHRKEGSRYPTTGLSVAYGNVFFSLLGDDSFRCLDGSNGDEKWVYTPEESLGKGVPYTTAAVNGLVYVGASSGYFYALDTEDGSEVWKTNLSCDDISDPAADGETVYVSTPERLVSLDDETGDENWRVESAFEDPVVVGDVVYVSGKKEVISQTKDHDRLRGAMVYAFDASTGDGLWSFETRSVKGREEINRGVNTPVVVGGVAYVSTEVGDIYALGEGSKGYEEPDFSDDSENYCK